jgi:hypothetical protein
MELACSRAHRAPVSLLVAYLDDAPVGMTTGVEMTHPDKGTEMFSAARNRRA